MTRDIEHRLIANLEAVGASITRKNIFERFSDDFVDEEDLAKCLGRLVADGRLVRSTRQRFGARDEFVYCIPGAPRMDAIAAAAEKLTRKNDTDPARRVDPDLLEEQQQSASGVAGLLEMPDDIPPEPAAAKRKPWPRKRGAPPSRAIASPSSSRRRGAGWAPKEVAEALSEKAPNVSYHLNAMVESGELQTKGRGNMRRFAALGVPATGPESSPSAAKVSVAAPKPKEKSAKKKTGARAPRTSTPGKPRNLAEFGASAEAARVLAAIPTFNGEVEVCGEPRCAIEDTGLFAIHDGSRTIRLTPKAISKVVSFLELTQRVWKGAK